MSGNDIGINLNKFYNMISFGKSKWNGDEDANKMFEEYPYWEEYDENKVYKNFEPNNDKMNLLNKKKYETQIRSKLYRICSESDNKYYYYVVFYKKFTYQYFEKLKKYCSCNYHKTHWCNPLKIFMCRHCEGCLDIGQDGAAFYHIIKAEKNKILSDKMTEYNRKNKFSF